MHHSWNLHRDDALLAKVATALPANASLNELSQFDSGSNKRADDTKDLPSFEAVGSDNKITFSFLNASYWIWSSDLTMVENLSLWMAMSLHRVCGGLIGEAFATTDAIIPI